MRVYKVRKISCITLQIHTNTQLTPIKIYIYIFIYLYIIYYFLLFSLFPLFEPALLEDRFYIFFEKKKVLVGIYKINYSYYIYNRLKKYITLPVGVPSRPFCILTLCSASVLSTTFLSSNIFKMEFCKFSNF